MDDDLAIAEAAFRHALAARHGAVVFLALRTARDDPPADLVARLADRPFPIKPVSAANTSERTESRTESSSVTVPTGPWWRNILAFFGLVQGSSMTSGSQRQSVVAIRRLTDAETGATGTLVRVGAIERPGPDEATVEVETSGEPLPTVATHHRLVRDGATWTVADRNG